MGCGQSACQTPHPHMHVHVHLNRACPHACRRLILCAVRRHRARHRLRWVPAHAFPSAAGSSISLPAAPLASCRRCPPPVTTTSACSWPPAACVGPHHTSLVSLTVCFRGCCVSQAPPPPVPPIDAVDVSSFEFKVGGSADGCQAPGTGPQRGTSRAMHPHSPLSQLGPAASTAPHASPHKAATAHHLETHLFSEEHACGPSACGWVALLLPPCPPPPPLHPPSS